MSYSLCFIFFSLASVSVCLVVLVKACTQRLLFLKSSIAIRNLTKPEGVFEVRKFFVCVSITFSYIYPLVFFISLTFYLHPYSPIYLICIVLVLVEEALRKTSHDYRRLQQLRRDDTAGKFYKWNDGVQFYEEDGQNERRERDEQA